MCIDGSPGVYLYADANYGGACSYFAFVAGGTSGSPDPATWAVGDNNASSMRIIPLAQSGPASVTVTLYDTVGYTNVLLSWTTSQTLGVSNFGMSKIPIDNRTSSIQLKQQTSTCQVKCF
jgi:hypothetical protein